MKALGQSVGMHTFISGTSFLLLKWVLNPATWKLSMKKKIFGMSIKKYNMKRKKVYGH